MARGKRPTIIHSGQTYCPGPTDAYWRHAEEIAQEIVVFYKHHLDSPHVGRVRLVKLRVGSGKGVVYYMTIEVTGKNGINTSYDVKVNRYPATTPYEIVSFDKIAGSESKTKNYISDGNNESDEKASGTKGGKKRASHSTMPDDNESSTESASGVAGRLRTRGFYILVEQIRSERPSLSYAKARKTASSTWGKLPEDEKMKFIGKAAKRLQAEAGAGAGVRVKTAADDSLITI